jgi:hypothetical protein
MNDPVPKLPDRRVRPGKLKNWRRRYREEVDEKSVVLPQEPGNQSKLVLYTESGVLVVDVVQESVLPLRGVSQLLMQNFQSLRQKYAKNWLLASRLLLRVFARILTTLSSRRDSI